MQSCKEQVYPVDNRGKEYSIMQINCMQLLHGKGSPRLYSGESGQVGQRGPNDRCRFNHSPLLLIKLSRQLLPPPPPTIVDSFDFLFFFLFQASVFRGKRFSSSWNYTWNYSKRNGIICGEICWLHSGFSLLCLHCFEEAAIHFATLEKRSLYVCLYTYY